MENQGVTEERITTFGDGSVRVRKGVQIVEMHDRFEDIIFELEEEAMQFVSPTNSASNTEITKGSIQQLTENYYTKIEWTEIADISRDTGKLIIHLKDTNLLFIYLRNMLQMLWRSEVDQEKHCERRLTLVLLSVQNSNIFEDT